MTAVILAHNKSAETEPLSLTRPKAMLNVSGKTLLEHNLDFLNGQTREVIIIVDFLKNLIVEKIGDHYKNLSIRYKELNNNPVVTILQGIQSDLQEIFILLNTDSLYIKKDMDEVCCINKKKLQKLSEKDVPGAITSGSVIVKYSWDILKANEIFMQKICSQINGDVESGAAIKGEVRIGKGSLIKSGAYIEGPVIIGENCIIGPNCFVRRNTVIGNSCMIGNGVELKNTIIGERVNICHLSFFGDSLIGSDVNIGAGTISANVRHDQKNIRTILHGETIDTGLAKFGTVIGDNVHTGINTSIYPGRKIWPGVNTFPGEIVHMDKTGK